eukprot:4346921-Alexandrium_andersonii.AAC.1
MCIRDSRSSGTGSLSRLDRCYVLFPPSLFGGLEVTSHLKWGLHSRKARVSDHAPVALDIRVACDGQLA